MCSQADILIARMPLMIRESMVILISAALLRPSRSSCTQIDTQHSSTLDALVVLVQSRKDAVSDGGPDWQSDLMDTVQPFKSVHLDSAGHSACINHLFYTMHARRRAVSIEYACAKLWSSFPSFWDLGKRKLMCEREREGMATSLLKHLCDLQASATGQVISCTCCPRMTGGRRDVLIPCARPKHSRTCCVACLCRPSCLLPSGLDCLLATFTGFTFTIVKYLIHVLHSILLPNLRWGMDLLHSRKKDHPVKMLW